LQLDRIVQGLHLGAAVCIINVRCVIQDSLAPVRDRTVATPEQPQAIVGRHRPGFGCANVDVANFELVFIGLFRSPRSVFVEPPAHLGSPKFHGGGGEV
jgi:hypothetical protein